MDKADVNIDDDFITYYYAYQTVAVNVIPGNACAWLMAAWYIY